MSSNTSAPPSVGFSEDKNSKFRRTMEDSTTYIKNFNSVQNQFYFGIFDGHAGKQMSDHCGNNLHKLVLNNLNSYKSLSDNLNKSFNDIDHNLNFNSGCTAVVSLIRYEDNNGNGFVNGNNDTEIDQNIGDVTSTTKFNESDTSNTPVISPPQEFKRRVLYTANVGDARAVLCRNGQPIRLTYDHKGSDENEQKRIIDRGGYILNDRVNGVLAVTRALGDSPMKQYVVGNPYTTEIELQGDDEFLVIACDGLWDIANDQQVIDLIRDIKDPQIASKTLLDFALENSSTDNLSILVYKINNI